MEDFTTSNSDLNSLRDDIAHLNDKVDKLYSALMGSDVTKDGGLVGRIVQLEKDVDILHEDHQRLFKKEFKNEVFQRIAYGLLLFIGVEGFKYIFEFFFKK